MFREFWFGLFPWFSPCFVRAGAVRLPGVLDRVPGCPFLAGLLGLRASSFIFSSEEGSSEFFGALSVLPGLLIVTSSHQTRLRTTSSSNVPAQTQRAA